MVDKKVLKFYIIGLIVSIATAMIPSIMDFTSEHMQAKVYTLPIGATGAQQAFFFYLFAILLPYPTIILGYGLAYLVVRLYTRLTKISKRITFVGYANIERSGHYYRRRYLIQLIFGALLATNVWIMIVTNPNLMKFWLSTEGQAIAFSTSTGALQQFTYTPWYWVPLMFVTPIFAMCAVIQDSGLISVKKVSGQSEFEDTERIGDKIFGIVKGYAGISVIIGFITLIQSPQGGEMSLLFYPMMALVFLLHLIIAIDLFRDIGRKWIFKAVKPYYSPQLLELSYSKKDITDINDVEKR
jgi:hypothetical protein